MLRKNFPGRVKIRRRGALERLEGIGSTGCGEVNANTVQILRRRLDERKTLEDRINTTAPARVRRQLVSVAEGISEQEERTAFPLRTNVRDKGFEGT